MFAGHIGAALAIGRTERGVNVGVFIAAAFLLDIVLWILVLLGLESVTIPADFAHTHQAQFVFPYSHGLLASVAWSALAGVVGFVAYSRRRTNRRAAVLIGAAVLSHWILDALVHRPELPLAGYNSLSVGFGLWNFMPLALTLEAVILVGGLYLFVSGAKPTRGRSIALAALCFVVMTFTALGMTLAPAPPSATAMAASSLGTVILVCALGCWLGRAPRRA